MEGDTDLPHRRSGEEQRPLLPQEVAVGGDIYFIARLSRQSQDGGKLRVEERLPHDVEVDVLRDPLKAAEDPEKSSAVIKALLRRVPGQKEQARLQTLVISI